MTQLMPLQLTFSCFSIIQIGFTYLVPAHPGSPGKGAVKRVCVCCYCLLIPVYVYGVHVCSTVKYLGVLDSAAAAGLG